MGTLRTRERGSFTDGKDIGYRSGAVYSTSYREALKVGEYQQTTDVVTPKFRRAVEAGRIVNNPFSSIQWSRRHMYQGPVILQGGYTWEYQYSYWDPPDLYGYVHDGGHLLSEVYTETAARVGTPDVDGVVEVGEAKETMELFRLRTWNLIDHLRKERKYATRKGHGAVVAAGRLFRDNWLKYRYGIMPLVSLMNDALVKGTRIATRRETARGAASEYFSIPAYRVVNYSNSRFDSTYTVSCNGSLSVRGGILYEYRDFYNRYGFNLYNVPAGAWNLLPYSFVIDWFTNTGEFINALTPRLNVVRLATWHGWVQETTYACTGVHVWKSPSGYTLTRAQSGMHYVKSVRKVRNPTLPGPVWRVREHALREVATSPRVVDALALASQLLFR